METLVLLLLLVFIPPLLLHPSVFHTEGKDFLAFLVIFCAMVFAAFAQAHRVVYGFADTRGIRYQRYLRWKYVNWEQIEAIAKRPLGAIHVDVQGLNVFSRHLVFIKHIVVFGGQSTSVTFDDLREMWIRARSPQ